MCVATIDRKVDVDIPSVISIICGHNILIPSSRQLGDRAHGEQVHQLCHVSRQTFSEDRQDQGKGSPAEGEVVMLLHTAG